MPENISLDPRLGGLEWLACNVSLGRRKAKTAQMLVALPSASWTWPAELRARLASDLDHALEFGDGFSRVNGGSLGGTSEMGAKKSWREACVEWTGSHTLGRYELCHW